MARESSRTTQPSRSEQQPDVRDVSRPPGSGTFATDLGVRPVLVTTKAAADERAPKDRHVLCVQVPNSKIEKLR